MIKLLRRIFHDNHPIDGCGIKPSHPKPKTYQVDYLVFMIAIDGDDVKKLNTLTNNAPQYIANVVKKHIRTEAG